MKDLNNTTKKILFGTVGAAGLFLASSASVNADTTHHVVKNDTVWDLSQKYGVSIQSIEQLNKINTDTHLIREGQTLTIPTTGKTATKTSQVTVKAGDTLWALAQKYGTTVEKLRQLNGLASDAYLIHVGDVIKVDGQVTATSTSSQATPATSSEASQTSQAASTASSEASQTGQAASTASSEASQTSQATSTASSEASQAASTSQAATPYVAANHVTYTVQAGDSLYTIAQKYGVTVDSLRQANTLGATLQVGQSLTVNDPTKNPQASVATSQAEQTPAQTTTTSQATQATQTTQAATTTNQVAQTTSQPAAQTQTSQASQTTQASQQTQASQAQVATPSSYSVSALLSYAQTFTGVPYVLGGTTPAGFDCSGFTQYVFNHFGKNIGRTTYQQQYAGTKLAVSSAQPGDLLFWGAYGSAYHVGIYLGGSSYIAAPEPGESVSVKSFTYYQPSFAVHVN